MRHILKRRKIDSSNRISTIFSAINNSCIVKDIYKRNLYWKIEENRLKPRRYSLPRPKIKLPNQVGLLIGWFFNVGLEQWSGRLPTVWDSALRMIRWQAITILIRQGGLPNEDYYQFSYRKWFFNKILEKISKREFLKAM